MLRRVPRGSWILLAVAVVTGLVGITIEAMLPRDILLAVSVGCVLAALVLLIKPSRERR